MSLLYRIIYAAHANGTHHKLALDALLKLQHRHADGWRNMMLKHVAPYPKAPRILTIASRISRTTFCTSKKLLGWGTREGPGVVRQSCRRTERG